VIPIDEPAGASEALLLDYLSRREAGEEIDLGALCREHPEHAEALKTLHGMWEVLDSIRRRGEAATISQRLERELGEPVDPQIDLGAASESSSTQALIERLRAEGPRGTRYRILGEIARGGMGAVLKVRDDELRRTLAMKVMLQGRPGDPDSLSGTRSPLATGRFLEEAQVTGQLDHPGIVPLHELGLDRDGRLYFTMRLVRGEDLRTVFEHVESGRGGWSQVRALGVLLKACEALSYAHAKGVIHRDLKPANIMVGQFGEVYVMDWGLARVLGRKDRHDLRLAPDPTTASAVRTEREEQRDRTPDSPLVTVDGTIVGTPCYMPPEQAMGRLDELGPHSDVYSIGAMLYHLVTGQKPYIPPRANLSWRTVLAAVVSGPPRPVEELAPRAPLELVAIVEKAMARAIPDRYSTTLELAQDLRAYLEGRVVAAYETGAWAEARKWVKRNRPLAGSLAAAVLAIVLGVVAFAVEAGRATRAAAAAARNAKQAELNAEHAERNAVEARASEARAVRVTELVRQALVGADPNQGGSEGYLVVDAMQAAVEELEAGALEGDPETEVLLRTTIAEILEGNGRSEEALRLADRGLAIARELHPGDDPEVSACLTHVGHSLESLGRDEEALEHYEAALEMDLRLSAGDEPEVAVALSNVAGCLQSLGRYEEALERNQAALAMRQRLFVGDHPHVARSLNNTAACLRQMGRAEEALPAYVEALAMQRRLTPGDHPGVATTINNLAYCLQSLGRLEQALPQLREAFDMMARLFGGDHPDLAVMQNNVAGCLQALGRREEALTEYLAALEMRQRLYPGDHPDVAASFNNVGSCLAQIGRTEEAAERFEAALDMLARLGRSEHPGTAVTLDNLGYCLKSMGRLEEALERYRAAGALRARLFRGDHPDVARGTSNLAGCYRAMGRSGEALELYEQVLEMQERLFPEDHPELAGTLNNLAATLADLGRLEEALATSERADAMAARVLPAGHPTREAIGRMRERIRTKAGK